MTEEDKKLLDRINEYAERKLNDPDKKMRVSSQLDRLKPIMLKIAEEQNTTCLLYTSPSPRDCS